MSLNPKSAAWLPQEMNISSDESEEGTKSRTVDQAVVQSPGSSQHAFYSQGQHNERTLSPPRAGAGLPSSQSCLSASALLSPSSSGRPSYIGSVSGTTSSPEYGRLGTLTEPRNFAPQTSGLSAAVTSEPPPKFDLGLASVVRKSDTLSANERNTLHTTYNPLKADLDIGGGAIVPFASHRDVSPYGQVQRLRSDTLNRLTATESGLPILHTALDPQYFPFLEGARQAVAVNHGVVKLKNIPFATKRSEVIAFLGRNSKILNDSDEPVHIIMERVTSKTMDAYVEFVSLDEANKAVEKHQQHFLSGRVSRLGDRPVDVELSSQESLMKDLFPLAKGIVWNGVSPQFRQFNPKEPWDNFKGFVSEEEMIMLVKHVEVPHRSPFSKDCPQRPYECLISTLKKFPWYATDRITISQRQSIFKATCELARLLSRSIQRQDDQVNLTDQLYRRLITAAMKCPGFTALMKDDIAYLANLSEMEERQYNQPRFANCWRHQYSLVPKPGMPLDVIEWYIAMIREQTHRDMVARPHADRTILLERSQDTDMYWGYFWAEVGFMFGPTFDQMTLSQAAQEEFTAVERILARALAPQ
ncbi:RNA recognition motif domain protein [Metarhizium album ARSEF 1941]|uniref:RNA recognition motif domain protein n=1 Tax=Metarhizium album (strain ARSEF 1941) TaxID=1081103 RepID=A0A0B2X3Q7_METAS|nr:RNA recognition motif domain protein [Metarhizium album ARSEF 1941]KHO00373.1 RNA recognition motif domain protein [Metarhizium album ARSEF 1941]